MSHNCGAIHVDASACSQAEVVEAVVAYWKKKKALVDKKSPLDIEPLTLEDSDRKARLGYAISPATKGWFAICDTEQYSADSGLAEHLAKVLKTRVAWYTLWGASSQGAARLFGTWKRKAPKDTYDAVWSFASEFPHGTTQFGDLTTAKARKGFALFGFKGVDPNAYHFGPSPDEPEAKKPKSKKGAKKVAEPKKSAAQDEAHTLETIDTAFLEKKFKGVQSAVEALQTPAGRFRALQTVTDHVYCWSISIKAPVAHGIVLTLADAALSEPLSRSLHTWVKQKRSMSAHMIAATYIGTLEAAAWANDKARFAAALALVDAGDKQGASAARATKNYCAQSVERLAKARPAFAEKIRALGDSLPG